MNQKKSERIKELGGILADKEKKLAATAANVSACTFHATG